METGYTPFPRVARRSQDHGKPIRVTRPRQPGGMQLSLRHDTEPVYVPPFRAQLLKWVGNKQRFAHEIISYFPSDFQTYYEPFLGSGAVLATLAPHRAVGSDVFGPLMEIWCALRKSPDTLIGWYQDRYERMVAGDKTTVYEAIKASYNASPNGADLVFLCRSCYGGIVRFRKKDGHMSTPCGIHQPISPASFANESLGVGAKNERRHLCDGRFRRGDRHGRERRPGILRSTVCSLTGHSVRSTRL